MQELLTDTTFIDIKTDCVIPLRNSNRKTYIAQADDSNLTGHDERFTL